MQDVGKAKAKAYAKLRKKDYTGAFEGLLSAMLQELRLGRDVGRTLEELYKPAYLLYKLGDSYQIQTWRQLVKPHLPIFISALEHSTGNLTLHLWNEISTIATKNYMERILFGKASCLYKLEKYNLAWDCYLKLISMKSNGELIKLLKLIGDLESWPIIYLSEWCELVLKNGNEELLNYLENKLKSLKQEPSMINHDFSNDDDDSSAILKANINEHTKKLSEEMELLKVSKSTLNSEIQNLKSKESQKNSECMKISSKEAQLSYETDKFRVMDIEQEIQRMKMRVRNLDKQIEEQSRKISQREYSIEKHKSRAEEYEKKKENLNGRLEEFEKNETEPEVKPTVTVNSKFEILLETWEKLFDKLIHSDLLRKANFLWDLKQYEKSWLNYIEFYKKSYSYKILITMFSLAYKLEKRGNSIAIETWQNLALEFVENNDQSSEFLFSLKRDMCMKGKVSLFKELDDRMHSARIARNPTGEMMDWKYLRRGSRISTVSTCSVAETSTEYLRSQLQAQIEK